MKKFLSLMIINIIPCIVFASEVNIGDKKITLPLFDGMVLASSVSHELVKYIGQNIPSNLRTLDGYIEQSDVLRLETGKDALFDKYIIIVTPKASEQRHATLKDFAAFKQSFRKSFTLSLEKQKDIIRKVDQAEIKINKLIPLGINYETDSLLSLSMLSSMKINSNGYTNFITQIATLNCLLIDGKLLLMYVYKKYRTEDDLTLVKETGRKICDQIVAANKRTVASSNDLKKFVVDGQPKAKGARFSIEMPASWEWKEGTRPNIVQFFGGGLQNGLIPYAEIMVKNFSDSKRGAFAEITKEDAANPQNLQGFIPAGMKYVRSGLTKLDGETVLWYETSQQTERAHNRITSHALYYLIPDNGRIIFITFGVGQVGYHANSQIAFNKYRPLFQRIISSFILTSEWK